MVARFTPIVFLLLIAAPVLARVSGPCVNCHTMHDSQEGLSMVEGSSVPNPALLRKSCAICHRGTNSGGTTPYIWDSIEPNYGQTGTEVTSDTLAGGSFYWVSTGLEASGHNVDGLTGQDGRLFNTPPGGADLGGRLSCAGTFGCHGDRSNPQEFGAMAGTHHGTESPGWKDGSTVSESFRFLLGVKGLEDPAFEFRPDAALHHNKYYGVDRGSETDSPGTISSLCAQCHGNFHNGTGQVAAGSFVSPWLRHPTDFDMGRVTAGREFAAYNGGTGIDNPYSVVAPVATASTSDTLNSTVFSTTDDAIVMCLSCHRAHGSPFDAGLRWNYKAWPGGGYNGCAVCHTSKD